MDKSAWKVVKILSSIVLPPLGCWMQNGIQAHFWINVALLIFGNIILPGVGHLVCVGHAVYVVFNDDLDTQHFGEKQ